MIPLLQGPKSSQVHKDRVGQTLPGAERGGGGGGAQGAAVC